MTKITLTDDERKVILGFTEEVLNVGFGKVEIIVKDYEILDIIPKPRVRIKKVVKK